PLRGARARRPRGQVRAARGRPEATVALGHASPARGALWLQGEGPDDQPPFLLPLPFAAALHRGIPNLVRPDEQDLRGAGRRPRAASGLRARSARADRARQSFGGWNDGGAERIPRGGDREEPLTALAARPARRPR